MVEAGVWMAVVAKVAMAVGNRGVHMGDHGMVGDRVGDKATIAGVGC